MQGSRVGSCSRWEGARDVLSEISEDGQQKGERRASPTASSDSSEISPTISIFGSETSTDSIPHVRASSIAPVIGGAGLQFLSKAWGSASNADNGMRHGVSNFYVQKDEERPKPRPYGKSNLDSAVTRSFPQYKSTTTAEVLHEQGEDIDVDALLSSLRNCKEDEVIWWSKDHTPLRLPKTAGGDDNKENMYNEPSENWASHGPFSDIDDNKENNDPSKNWANHGPCSESDHSEIVVDTPAGFTCPENVATPEIEECESPPLNPRYLEAMLQTSSELQELEAEIELCTQYDSVPDGEVSKKTEGVETVFGLIRSGKYDMNEHNTNQQLLEMQRRLASISRRLSKVQDHLADVQHFVTDVRRMNCRCCNCRCYCYLQKSCSRLREIFSQFRTGCSRHLKENRTDVSEQRSSSIPQVKLRGVVVSPGARRRSQAPSWITVLSRSFCFHRDGPETGSSPQQNS